MGGIAGDVCRKPTQSLWRLDGIVALLVGVEVFGIWLTADGADAFVVEVRLVFGLVGVGIGESRSRGGCAVAFQGAARIDDGVKLTADGVAVGLIRVEVLSEDTRCAIAVQFPGQGTAGKVGLREFRGVLPPVDVEDA